MHFNYFCALLYIWHVGFHVFIFWKFEKCIYFVIYLYVFKLVCTRWENFIRIGKIGLYLKSCRCQLWIWWTILLAEGIWKVHIFLVIYMSLFKLVCTRWENCIRMWITVLYLKSCRCQLWTWRFQISVQISINSENQLLLFLKQNKLFYDIQRVMFTMTKTPYLSGNGKTTLLLVKLFIVMYFFVSPSGDLHILFYYTV